jgi:predicted dehydrogenase
MPAPHIITRRQTLKTLAALGAGALTGSHWLHGADEPAAAPAKKAPPVVKDPMRLAFVGVGGQGGLNLRNLVGHHFVAFADVDDAFAAPVYQEFSNVPHYRDYRELIDRHHKDLDGVLVCTPDHSHHPISVAAMEAGLNVFVEKPMATTIAECRSMEAAARRHKVVTQLGVQGHSMGALRVLKEWLDAGAIGKVRTVHLWTDRMQPARYVVTPGLPPEEPVPETLDWPLWLASRPARPFSSLYVPNRWRNWWDLGTGPLGDIGAHMFDVVEYALEVGFPDLVEAEVPSISPHFFPPWTRARWDFPARGARPAVAVHWCNGTKDGAFVRPASVPHLPPEVIAEATNGIAFVGDDATAFIPDMRASSAPRIFPPEREADVLANRPPATLPRPKGSHFDDWFTAIREGREAGANFSYGAPLTEVVLLGVLAQRTGQPIRWDRAAMRTRDNPAADAHVRPPLRAGLSLG